jgi:hypothetical protein
MKFDFGYVLLAALLVFLAVDNFKLRAAFERYTIANGHNIGLTRIKDCKTL